MLFQCPLFFSPSTQHVFLTTGHMGFPPNQPTNTPSIRMDQRPTTVLELHLYTMMTHHLEVFTSVQKAEILFSQFPPLKKKKQLFVARFLFLRWCFLRGKRWMLESMSKFGRTMINHGHPHESDWGPPF